MAVFSVAAQKTDAVIVGHIVDQDGKHLPHITITVDGTTVGTVADATGHFTLTDVPVGELTVKASGMGYTSQSLKVTTAMNKTVEAKFTIEESAVNVDQVVVSATRNESNRKEAATIVNVVSQKLFDNIASATLAETVPYQPGLRFETTCGNCGASELRINGLGGQYSQVLMDSRPIFSSLAGVYGLEMLPTSMIERVEVIRGGGSALYGSSAIGGVVNIITKEPLFNSASLANTTNVMKDGTTDVVTSLNTSLVTDDHKAGISMFGMIRNKGAYDRNGDTFSETSKMNSKTLGFNSFFKPSNYSKINVEYHYISEFRRGGDMAGDFNIPVILTETTEQLEHDIHGASLSYDYLSPNQKSKFNIYSAVQSIKRESYFGGDLIGNILAADLEDTGYDLDSQYSDAVSNSTYGDDRSNVSWDDVVNAGLPYGYTTDLTLTAGGQYTFMYGNRFLAPGNLTVGVEYTMNNLDETLLSEYVPEIKQNVDTYGAYVQNEWNTEKFNLTIGARVEGYKIEDLADDNPTISDVVVMPRASLRYTPVDGVGLRASYSSGYRAPQAYSEDLHIESVGGGVSFIVMDDDLVAEYSHSVNASIDLYKNFGKVQANLLVEGFYTKLNDAFSLEDDSDNVAGQWVRTNVEEGAYVAGVSADLRLGIPNKFDVQLGYTFQKSKYNTDVEYIVDDKDESIMGDDMLRSPDHYGYFTATYNVTKNFTTSLFGNYTGSMVVVNEADLCVNYKTDDFFDMGFKLAYNFPVTSFFNIEINAGMKNIFDAYQSDLTTGRADRDPGYIYGPTLPRTYFVGAKFNF